MKRHIISTLLFAVPVLLQSQVPTQNYVKSTQMLNGGQSLSTIQYYDGLGRPFEKVLQGVTPSHSNLVYLTEYDGWGRESRQWLPAVSSQIFMEPSSVASAVASSHGNDTHAYMENHYDGSPLNRIVAQDLEGAEWVGHPVKTEYLTNNQQMPLACIDYSVSGNALQTGSFYATGTLQVIKTTDVAGNVCYIFTDMQKHKVLERRMDGNSAHDTYYVYDQRGDLRYVLQPMYQQEASIEKYAFQYKYDDRHNVIEKRLPGCDPVRYAYDRANRLILSQDGRQRSSGKATFMLYDKHNRMVLKGVCDCSTLPDQRSSVVTVSYDSSQDGICSTGYTDPSWSLYTRSPQVEAAYYYDDYRFAGKGIFSTPGILSGTGAAKGLLTGEITSFNKETPRICAVYQYDEKGRLVKTTKSNIMNGTETITTTYSLTDKPLSVIHEFRLGSQKTTERQTYIYDHADRLVSVTHKLGNHPQVTLTENTYDKLCRLSARNVMGEQITYQYNVRDWMISMTSPHYSQNMTYNLDGNINNVRWSHSGESALRTYSFTYDNLSRLKQAEYISSGKIRAFSTRYVYDLNGNITELYRNAPDDNGGYTAIDELAMTYNGNQLIQVENGSDDEELVNGVRYNGGNLLTYDKNGCLTSDKDKEISSIQYNSLNLPTYMKIGKKGSARYLYDSKGNKIEEQRKVANMGILSHQTRYCDNFIFEDGVLKRILVEGGFIYFGENDTTYHYFLKDHLGSNRAVVNMKTGEVAEQYDYYPFGKQHGDYHTGYIHPYRYNGKELDEIGGLDWLHYGARMMEPAWGRFTTPDPMAENEPGISPYTYCVDNPINMTDPDGLYPIWNGKTGKQTRYYDSVTNEELTWAQVSNWIHFGNYEGTSSLENAESESSKTITPQRVGFEWLSGCGERHRTFVAGDYFTEMLKKHSHIQKCKKRIAKLVKAGWLNSKSRQKNEFKYDLSGIQGIGKYIKDYSTLFTNGATGNLAVTYLGSYDLQWSVIKTEGNTALVLFEVNNASTIQSGTRPPLIGYTSTWKNTIGEWLNNSFSSGPMSKTTQKFVWTEKIDLK